MRVLRRLAAVALAIALGTSMSMTGCHAPLSRSLPEDHLLASGAYRLVPGLDVPPVRGVEGCGAQALATVLAHLDAGADAEALAESLPWHDVGATAVDLLLEARHRGFESKVARGSWESILALIDAGQPALVMIDRGYEVRTLFARYSMPTVMHWAVLSGVALDGTEVLLAARGGRHFVVERADFQRRWAESDQCLITVGLSGASAPRGAPSGP